MKFSGSGSRCPRDYGWGVRVRRPFGARGMSSVRYRTRLGDLKNKQSTERVSGDSEPARGPRGKRTRERGWTAMWILFIAHPFIAHPKSFSSYSRLLPLPPPSPPPSPPCSPSARLLRPSGARLLLCFALFEASSAAEVDAPGLLRCDFRGPRQCAGGSSCCGAVSASSLVA